MRRFASILIVGICLVLIVFIFIATNEEVKRCKAKGGEMIGSGTYETLYTLAGDVLVPVMYEITECSK